MRKRPSQTPLPLYKRLWLSSQTKFLAYTQATTAGAFAAVDVLNNVLSDSHFTNVLGYMNVPKKVYLGIAILALVTWLAHGRSQDK